MSQGGTVTGTIYSIGETQQITDRFRKRTIVIAFADNPKYPQVVELQVTGDKCGDLDRWAEGEIVTASYNLRGRESKGRVWNTLDVWKIEPASDVPTEKPARSQRQERPATAPKPDYRDDAPPLSDEDIPF